MKRLIVLVILAVMFSGFLLSSIADNSAAATDSSIPYNE